MSATRPNFRCTPRPLQLALWMAFPALALHAPAYAQTTTSGSSTVNSSTDTVTPTTGAVSDLNQPGFGLVSATLAADGSGSFASALSAVDDGFSTTSASSTLTLTQTLTNTTGTTQTASFSLDIPAISFAYTTIYPGSLTESFNATIDASVGGAPATQVWASGATLTATGTALSYPAVLSDATSVAFSTSGTDPGLAKDLATAFAATPSTLTYISQNVAFASPEYTETLDLGSLAAGQSLTVSYTVDLGLELNGYGGTEQPSASVTFGDPANLSAGGKPNAQLSLAGTVTAVPEPTELAQLAAGLAMAGLALRRRRGASRA